MGKSEKYGQDYSSIGSIVGSMYPGTAGFRCRCWHLNDVRSHWLVHGVNKPWFTPPNYVFGPVWTVLYILMGISLYLVIIQGWENKTVKTGIVLFAAQLGANLLWSLLFFGLHSPVASLACILVLLALIVATIITFSRLSKPAAVLLVPYLAWVCIATALNAGIVFLN